MNSPFETGARSLFFIYGPPGSGKSSAGRLLAQALEIPFWDVDAEIEARSRMSIPKIFARYGETGFRKREHKVLERLLAHRAGVISLGGGALLDAASRAQVEALGPVLCLQASLEALLDRLELSDDQRPLLAGDLRPRLEDLLAARQEHYASFPLQIETDGLTNAEIAWQAQMWLGAFHVRGMGTGYDVRVLSGGLDLLGEMMVNRGIRGPVVIVSDENVAPLYAARAVDSLNEEGLTAHLAVIPPGEQYKTLETVEAIWEAFTRARLERSSSVVALGGGVVGDLAGFAAATYLRGISWVAVPTSLLAMVDASLGGKTGIDLPSGKNLVGAFHAPRLVLADPRLLESLAQDELRSGMAEVVKHGVISDPALFALCAQGWGAVNADLDALVRRALAVKVRVIQIDPFEQGHRAALNLGHTLGHAIEQASEYRIRHGDAVSIGMVAAARMAESLDMAEAGLAEEIAAVLHGLGLPTEVPAGLDQAAIQQSMDLDKKRAGGRVRFVLPLRVGEVKTGVEIEDSSQIFELLQ